MFGQKCIDRTLELCIFIEVKIAEQYANLGRIVRHSINSGGNICDKDYSETIEIPEQMSS